MMNFFSLKNVSLNASWTFLDRITIRSTQNLLGKVLKIVILKVIKSLPSATDIKCSAYFANSPKLEFNFTSQEVKEEIGNIAAQVLVQQILNNTNRKGVFTKLSLCSRMSL